MGAVRMLSGRNTLLLSAILHLHGEVWAQKSCEPCVTVKGDSGDALTGEYRLVGEESGCKEYGCSYTKVGESDQDIYCFKDGSYEAELPSDCPVTPLPGSTVEGSSPPGGSSPPSGGSTPPGDSTAPSGTGITGTEATVEPPAITGDEIEKTEAKIEDQKGEIAKISVAIENASDEVKVEIEVLKEKLDKLDDALGSYKITITTRRKKRATGCDDVDERKTKLTDIKEKVQEVQQIITNIEGNLTSSDTAIQEVLTPIKDYWENYEKIADEDLAKIEAEKTKCEAAPPGVSESGDDATTAGETTVAETTPAETTLEDTTPPAETTLEETTPAETTLEDTTPPPVTTMEDTTPPPETTMKDTTPAETTLEDTTTPAGTTPPDTTTPAGTTPADTTTAAGATGTTAGGSTGTTAGGATGDTTTAGGATGTTTAGGATGTGTTAGGTTGTGTTAAGTTGTGTTAGGTTGTGTTAAATTNTGTTAEATTGTGTTGAETTG